MTIAPLPVGMNMKWLLLLSLLVACNKANKGDDTSTPCNEANETCGNGTSCGGEGGEMLPGSDCLACHTGGEGGTFTLGGTIYADIDGKEPLVGATIFINSVNEGHTVEKTSNFAGNFYGTNDIPFPATVQVVFEGQTRDMVTEISTGACNTCHLCAGAAGGKIYAP